MTVGLLRMYVIVYIAVYPVLIYVLLLFPPIWLANFGVHFGILGSILVFGGIALSGLKGGVITSLYVSLCLAAIPVVKPEILWMWTPIPIIGYFLLGIFGGKLLDQLRAQRDRLSLERTKFEHLVRAHQENEERYRKLIELSPEAIFVISGGKIELTNTRGAQILGFKNPEQLRGTYIKQFISGESSEQIMGIFHQPEMMKEEKTVIECNWQRVEGVCLEIEASISPMHYDGQFSLLCVVRDVTDRKTGERMLREANEVLQRLSDLDGLTAIPNRRAFDAKLEAEWKKAAVHSLPLSLLMADIDFFKTYNDAYGHQAGDESLQQVAAVIEQSVKRTGDFAARYGGEEFAVILPGADSQGAEEVAERIRKAVISLHIAHKESMIADTVTISMGVASVVPGPDSDARDLILAADKALYQAKQEGRNRVAAFKQAYLHTS